MKRKIKGWSKKLGFFVASYFVLGYLVAFFDGNCVPFHKMDDVHCDYYFRVAKYIPWGWTTRCLVQPPIMIAGNSRSTGWTANGRLGPKPIPEPGEWQLSVIQVKEGWPLYLPYFAVTFSGGMHFRIGTRWDDVDGYYVVASTSIKDMLADHATDKSLANNTTCR